MVQITLTRRYEFAAAHFLPHVPAGHKCQRPHGHNYVVDVTVTGPLGEPQGWILDSYELDALLYPALAVLDHATLNEIEGLTNPTTENLAVWLLRTVNVRLRMATADEPCPSPVFCCKIRVQETPTSWGEASISTC
jgi:6-pyruvoyltetrahydropterin/6-carboxytetrahydropterin synthase